MVRLLTGVFLSFFLLTACADGKPRVIVITATTPPEETTGIASAPMPSMTIPLAPPSATALPFIEPLSNPTLDPTRPPSDRNTAQEYVVQAGDTLYRIAQLNNVSLDTLLSVNDLVDPNLLTVGQIIQLPNPPDYQTSVFKIIPDSRLVRGPGSHDFDVNTFVVGQPGYIRIATDEVKDRWANGSETTEILTSGAVVERVSIEYSVDPRLLLALLEYRAGWLSNPEPSEELLTHPLISEEASGDINRSGLYKQLSWAANTLNQGYYDWKYRGVTTLEFTDGTRLLYAPGLNAGTIGLQYFLSLNTTAIDWQTQIEPEGFYQTYAAYFGDPFAGAIDPLVPPGIQQPVIAFPFAAGETWYYTGGPHGGWGNGSAWAAVDIAPPDDIASQNTACYTSEYPITAVAPGVIVRSDKGSVVLDLDGDGDETTGWTVLYLHLATQGRIAAGTTVVVGDPVGYASCEGGVSYATHMHIARRYNGEWIPAYCHHCVPGQETPAFVMNDWTIIGLENQLYQGYMQKGEYTRVALEGRNNTDNQITW